MTTDTRIDPATTEARCRRLMAEHAAIEARGWTSQRARVDLRELWDAMYESWLEAAEVSCFDEAHGETSPAPDAATSAEPSAPPAATGEGYVFRAASVGEAHDLVTETGHHRCLRCGAESMGAAPALPCIGKFHP